MEISTKGVDEMAEKLTKEAIFAVADAIATEGQQVRVAEVHRRLGYGSLTTITNAVREWREHHKPTAPVEQEVVPQTVTDRLAALGAELWTQARAAAEEGLTKEREALESYRAELEDQQQETAEYADALNDANERLKESNTERQNQIEVLRGEKEALANLLKTTNDQLIAAETREQSSAKHLEDMKEDSRGLRELLAKREVEHDSTVQNVQQQAVEISRLREELAGIKERQSFTEQQLSDERTGREQTQKELEASRGREQAAEVKAAKLEGEVTALRSQVTAAAKKETTKANKPDQTNQ